VKSSPRLTKAHERQEREICLSCQLPECIPDHFACGLHGNPQTRRRMRRYNRCKQCAHSILYTSDNPLAPRYYYCPEWGYYTMGWRKQCSRFRVRPEYREARRLKRKEQNDASRKRSRG